MSDYTVVEFGHDGPRHWEVRETIVNGRPRRQRYYTRYDSSGPMSSADPIPDHLMSTIASMGWGNDED
jgi:hypothetical protein